MELGSIQKLILNVVNANGRITAGQVTKLYGEVSDRKAINPPKHPKSEATMTKFELMGILINSQTIPLYWTKGKNFDKFYK